MFVNQSLQKKNFEEYFYKLTNLSEDLRDIIIKRIKILKKEKSQSIFNKISNFLDKIIFLLITLILIGYLYYNFFYVK